MRATIVMLLVLLAASAAHAQPPSTPERVPAGEPSGSGDALPARTPEVIPEEPSAHGDPGPAAPAPAAPTEGGEAPREAPASPAPAPVARSAHRIAHVPVHDAAAGQLDVELALESLEPTVTALVRFRGADGVVREAPVRRTERGLSARLEPIAAPYVDYWIVWLGADAQEPIFASEGAPHRVRVAERDLQRHAREEMAAREGRRSRVRTFAEWVDFGHRQVRGVSGLPDEYWHFSLDYTYTFADVVHDIRVEGGTHRGAVADLPGTPAARDAGFDYGLAELTWYFFRLLQLRTSVLLGFSQRGFDGGVGGELVIGEPRVASVSLGVRGLTTLGVSASVRLGWAAHPIVPLGATVEVTNFPAGADFGVRLLLDVAVQIYPGAHIRAYGGYSSRTSVTGGASVGGEVALAF